QCHYIALILTDVKEHILTHSSLRLIYEARQQVRPVNHPFSLENDVPTTPVPADQHQYGGPSFVTSTTKVRRRDGEARQQDRPVTPPHLYSHLDDAGTTWVATHQQQYGEQPFVTSYAGAYHREGEARQQDRPATPSSLYSHSDDVGTAWVATHQQQYEGRPFVTSYAGAYHRDGEARQQDRPATPSSLYSYWGDDAGTTRVSANQEQQEDGGWWEEKVSCHPRISHEDIAAFIRDYRDRLTETDRRLLQEGFNVVTTEAKWALKNAQLTIYGTDVTVVFFSGKETNKYLVHLSSEDRPTYVKESKGWKLKVKDSFKTAWRWVKRAAHAVAAPVTGGLIQFAIAKS
ncbi:uncharacterized protein LOC144904089, partial [Branchiostoma floridae x Branchiostoma belcheri]